MAMLAEPRRRQKWTLNPRGKQWSEDSNKFGQKMLEKMGWTNGKGLGAKEQGMTDHVRVKFKDDQSGIGYSRDNQDKQWTQHQDGFNELLMNLQKSQNLEPSEVMETKEIALSGTSLELKSKQSRARVHYQKFTRGKDVSRYSSKDLANIFGKKTLEEEVKPEETVEEEFNAEPVGSKDNTGGILTIKGGNISEYFKNKMSSTMKMNFEDKESKQENSDSEDERYVGFGFSNTKSDQCGSDSQSVQNFTNYAFENPCLDLNASPKAKPVKRKSLGFTNEGLDLNYLEKGETPEKVRKESEISETPDCFVNPALNLDSSVNETRNGAEFEVSRPQNGLVNPALDLSEETIKKKSKKKRKKDTESSGVGFVNPALNLECPVSGEHIGTEFEVPRVQMGLANDALDLSDEASGKKRVTFNDCVEYNTDLIKKKKGKTKLDKFEVENNKVKRKKKRAAPEEVPMVFVNEALDIEVTSEEVQDNEMNEMNERKSKKEKRKKNRRMSNLETIEEAPEEKDTSQDVICDLEVITVPDCVEEPETICEEAPKKSKKKKKKGEKIPENPDVIEIETVSQEKSQSGDNIQTSEDTNERKKKKKKGKKVQVEEEITIDGFDKENKDESLPIEKKKKKKKKSIETSEFFLDLTDEKVQDSEKEEKVEEPPSESKKNKKKRSRDSEAKLEPEGDSGSKEDMVECDSTPSKKRKVEVEASSEVPKSPYGMMARKSKSVLKSMFIKSPVVNFKGSNINEIRGYGIQ